MRAFNLIIERAGAASLSRTFRAAGHLQNVDDAAKSVQVKPASPHSETEELAGVYESTRAIVWPFNLQ
jgi:hypothetical protein